MPNISRWAPGILFATFLTFAVAGPWLAGGYWFSTDWPGPRRLSFPTEFSSSYLLQVVLAFAGHTIGGEATGKVFVIGVLLIAALTAYEAALVQSFTARAAGAIVYVVNPFVYGRLHYGQLFLLAGFAILPMVAATLRRLLLEPSPKSCAMAAASFVLLGILSIHLFMLAAILATVVAILHLTWAENKRAYLQRTGPYVLLAAGAALVASSYWVVSLLAGRGYEGTLLASVGSGDLRPFAAVPDGVLGLLPNLLGLYGFWAENYGRFASMKAFAPFWPAVLCVLLLIAGIGAAAILRNRRLLLWPWIAGLVTASVIGLVLEIGVSHPLTAGIVQWLDVNITLYRGLRDAGKWAALLALAYSQLIGLGTAAILSWLRQPKRRAYNSAWVVSVATGLLLAFPLYYGNGLLFGMHGEIKPSQYPSGWYAADRVLTTDKHPGRTLFLPWHEYMALSFVRNQNQVVAPPAPTFFSTQVLVSANPEIPGIAPPANREQVAIANLVQEAGQGHWGQVLADLGIKYVLLAHEVDWETYKYLDQQTDLLRVGEYGSIVLYRNRLAT